MAGRRGSPSKDEMRDVAAEKKTSSLGSMGEFFQGIDERAVAAELIGTFLFQFFGALAASNSVDAGLTTAAIGNGAALTVVTYSTARISGGHINPAVSLALLLIGEGQMSASKCVAYVLAQLTGALMAAAGLRFLCPNTAVNRNPFVTQGILSDGVSRNLAGLCIFEFIMTFTLMFVICAVALDVKGSARQYAPLVIGFTYAACMYCEGPYTGGSMNPARTLSAAIVFNDFTGMWVSLIAMFGGAVCGAFAYKATFNIDRPDSAAATSRSIVSQYV